MMNELFLNNECVKIEQIDIECLAFLQSHSPKWLNYVHSIDVGLLQDDNGNCYVQGMYYHSKDDPGVVVRFIPFNSKMVLYLKYV